MHVGYEIGTSDRVQFPPISSVVRTTNFVESGVCCFKAGYAPEHGTGRGVTRSPLY